MRYVGCFYRALSQEDSLAVWHEMISQDEQLGPLGDGRSQELPPHPDFVRRPDKDDRKWDAGAFS